MKPYRTMKTMAAALALALATGTLGLADDWMLDLRNQAVQAAVDKAEAEFKNVNVARDKTVAVLPFARRGGFEFEGRLKTALTGAGFTVVDAPNEPLWNEIMAAIERGERKLDILDPDTLVKFGQLKEYQVVLYGEVTAWERPGRMVYVELEMHLSSLETRQHLWGGRFADRRYVAADLRGPVALDPLVRKALAAAVADAVADVKASPGLTRETTAAMLPLAGDIDGYVAHLVKDAIVASGNVTLRELDVRTRGEAKAILIDKPATADALLIGAVRDVTPRYLVHDELFRRTYRAEADVQIGIEAKNGDVVWSGSGTGVEEEVEKETVITFIIKLLKEYSRVFIVIGAVLAVMIAWGALKRAGTRVR